MKKIICLTLTLAVSFSCMAFATGKLTVKEDYDPVEAFTESGILIGDEDGNLRLSDGITRAEFCKLLCETEMLADLSKGDVSAFDDVPKSHWAYDYINKVAKCGLINGVRKGIFAPEEGIRLVDAERIVLRLIGTYYDLSKDSKTGSAAMEIDLLDGIETKQLDKITREDAVTLLYNAATELAAEEAETYARVSSAASGGGSSGNKASSATGMAAPTISAPMAAAPMPMEDVDFDAVTEESGAILDEPYIDMPEFNTEDYSAINENGFKKASLSPLSTFSIDTDTASYSNMRRFVLNGYYTADGSIRTEELINYFTYDNDKPENGEIFAVTAEAAVCPWNEENILARISIQGEEIPEEVRQPQNLVFLIDTSGSMYSRDKLPLVKRSMSLLLSKLDERDTVSIVTYAGSTGVALEGAKGNEKEKILDTLNSFEAYGGTAGGAGLLLAYEQAEKFKNDGNNRIILCTDGDFNIGVSSDAELKSLVEEKRKSGIYLSVMGFGTGNLKDNKLEIIADNGNGSYYYIDNLKEAKKVLVDEMTKTLYTIANDVKIQVEFNPAVVGEYRLIGYENRMLATEDFENDAKDAGELGSGSTVTALYEIVPANGSASEKSLRYSTSEYTDSDELMCVNIRYKNPGESESILREYPVENTVADSVEGDFAFAAAVAELGMLLNDSEYSGNATYDSIIQLAELGKGEDKFGYRGEFISLVDILNLIDMGY